MYLSFNRFSHHNDTYDTREVNDQENIKDKHYDPKTSNSFNRRLHHSNDYEQGSQISTPSFFDMLIKFYYHRPKIIHLMCHF